MTSPKGTGQKKHQELNGKTRKTTISQTVWLITLMSIELYFWYSQAQKQAADESCQDEHDVACEEYGRPYKEPGQ